MMGDAKPRDDDSHRFYDDCPCPMFVYSTNTLKILAVNTAAVAWFGYSADEFTRLSLLDICPQDDADRVKQTVREIRDQKNFDSGYWKHVKKCGERRFVHTYSNATTYGGEPARLVLSTDVDKALVVENENREMLAATEVLAQRYENVLASLPVMIWRLSLDCKKLSYVNKMCEQVTGYGGATLMADGALFLRLVHPDDLPRFIGALHSLQEQENAQQDIRLLHRDGSVRELTGAAILLRDADNKGIAYCGFLTDMTGQRKIEHAFHQKAREVEDLLESMTDAFFAADSDWNLTYANKAAEKLYSVKRHEILGRNVWEVFPKVPGTIFYEAYQRTANDKVATPVEGWSPTSGKWLQSMAYPTHNGIAVLFHDYTEQKKLTEAVNSHVRNLDALINNTSDFVWSVDAALHVIAMNTACIDIVQRKFGVTLKPGDHILPVELGEDTIAERAGHYARALSGETFTVFNEDLVEGEVMYRETNFNPIKNNGGEVVGVSCFSRNVTEQKKRLLKIQSQNAHLKKIAWVQSHRVRGPIANILGLADLLNHENRSGADNEMTVKGIAKEVLRLDALVREIVALTYDEP